MYLGKVVGNVVCTIKDEALVGIRLMLVEPSSGADGVSLSTLQREPPPQDAALMVGPEGGWTVEECRMAGAAGVRPVTLGQRTLRADAVPVAAISVLQFLWGEM